MRKPWPKTMTNASVPLDSAELIWSPRLQRGLRCRLARWLFRAAFRVLPEPDMSVTCRISAGEPLDRLAGQG